MRNIFTSFLRFVREFPPARSHHLAFLALGGILMSLLEFIGLSAIFPFMLAVQMPDAIMSSHYLHPVFAFLHISDPKTAVGFLGLAIVGVFIAKNLLFIAHLRFEFSALARWRIAIGNRFYRAYIDAPYEYFLPRSSAEMISIITSVVPYLINNFIHQCVRLVTQALIGVAILLYMIRLDVTVALSLLCVSLLLLALHSLALRRAVVSIGADSRKLAARQLAILQQSLKGFKDTRLHQKGHFFARKFAAINGEIAELEEKIVFLQNLPTATIEIIVMAMIVAVFWVFMATEGNTTVVFAKLSTLAIIAFRTVPIVNRSITSLALINSCREPLEKFFKEAGELGLLGNPGQRHARGDVSPEAVEPLPFDTSIALEGISYRYPRARLPAIENVSFELAKGQFLGVTGQSGSGKTTLVGILLCFLPPLKGQILVDGSPVLPADAARLQKIIGYVDQNIFLLDASVAENVAYGEEKAEIDRARVEESLKKAQLWDFVSSLDAGVDTRIGEDGKNFSGGQRQRLAIARALYKRLQILILDEASATLDVETEHRFFEFLYGLKGELTVIMIAHRLTTLKDCDHILFMERGAVVDQGSFQTLYASNTMFRRLVEFSQVPDIGKKVARA